MFTYDLLYFLITAGPWRWYHERMLDCCVPISLVEHEGITFNQFVCLADCNSLDTQATKSGTGGTLEQFRETVMEYSKRDDAFLILSYSRKTVNQTGKGKVGEREREREREREERGEREGREREKRERGEIRWVDNDSYRATFIL